MKNQSWKLKARKNWPLIGACALLSGCSSAPEPETAVASPAPAATANTPALAAPTTASPALPAPAATPALSAREQGVQMLGENYMRYIEGFEQMVDTVWKSRKSVVRSLADATERRGTLRQAMAYYNRLMPPAEFIKADTLLRQAVLQETIALGQMETAFQFNSQSSLARAEATANSADDLYKRAALEGARVFEEIAKQADERTRQQPVR